MLSKNSLRTLVSSCTNTKEYMLQCALFSTNAISKHDAWDIYSQTRLIFRKKKFHIEIDLFILRCEKIKEYLSHTYSLCEVDWSLS